ncbi:hypothetical protein MARPO_0092s0002, partial [Marchantia polymorpha]
FRFTTPSAANVCQKAFVTNLIGDFGLLLDSMEGSTSISALIHAATMIAAGIFLFSRIIISWTGAITSLLEASIALAQNDLKKGIGSYKVGLFHLITYAFLKALLFLGSGSVIHSVEPIVGYHPNKSQNLIIMSGLRQYRPITAITILFGTLSLCGIPPFTLNNSNCLYLIFPP